MNRRELLQRTIAAVAVGGRGRAGLAAPAMRPLPPQVRPPLRDVRPPRRERPVDQLKFAADEGFHGWEDNGMGGRQAAEQERSPKRWAVWASRWASSW